MTATRDWLDELVKLRDEHPELLLRFDKRLGRLVPYQLPKFRQEALVRRG